jgi:hypothetical protein
MKGTSVVRLMPQLKNGVTDSNFSAHNRSSVFQTVHRYSAKLSGRYMHLREGQRGERALSTFALQTDEVALQLSLRQEFNYITFA